LVIDAFDQMPEMTGLPSAVRGGDQSGLSAACNVEHASNEVLIASARMIPLDSFAFMSIPLLPAQCAAPPGAKD
jgi:hypothetical protein